MVSLEELKKERREMGEVKKLGEEQKETLQMREMETMTS